MNLQTHSVQSSLKVKLIFSDAAHKYFFIILFALLNFTGCSKAPEKKEYVARVNDKYLTQEELDNMLGSSENKNFYKNEIIRNWINNELLYQKAVKEGITNDNEYKNLVENSKKELAVTLLLNKIYADEKESIDSKEVEEYYEQNQSDFKAFYDAYVINLIRFNNEDKAIKFRSTLIENDWNRALNVFKGDSSIISTSAKHIYYDYELQPPVLARIVKELNVNETSIVFNDEPGAFSVVQLVSEFPKGSQLPFEFVKEEVEDRLLANKKDELIKHYIKELYSENNIEIFTNKVVHPQK